MTYPTSATLYIFAVIISAVVAGTFIGTAFWIARDWWRATQASRSALTQHYSSDSIHRFAQGWRNVNSPAPVKTDSVHPKPGFDFHFVSSPIVMRVSGLASPPRCPEHATDVTIVLTDAAGKQWRAKWEEAE